MYLPGHAPVWHGRDCVYPRRDVGPLVGANHAAGTGWGRGVIVWAGGEGGVIH